jgi:hypothetical protein
LLNIVKALKCMIPAGEGITIPRVHDKLLTEISNATLSSPISDAGAKKLPYLQAVIKEGQSQGLWPRKSLPEVTPSMACSSPAAPR